MTKETENEMISRHIQELKSTNDTDKVGAETHTEPVKKPSVEVDMLSYLEYKDHEKKTPESSIVKFTEEEVTITEEDII